MPDPTQLLLPNRRSHRSVPIRPVSASTWDKTYRTLPAIQKAWVEAQDFAPVPGRFLVLPDDGGKTGAVLFVTGPDQDPFAAGKLAKLLPAGVYRFEPGLADQRLAALAWLLEAYEFTTRKTPARKSVARLICPAGVDAGSVLSAAQSVYLVRDLVNRPANDLGPEELEAEARRVARRHHAAIRVIKAAALERGFPMIHAVGKASPRQPRLIDFTWGRPRDPKVTIIGKGVCFDTGGLDIKPASGMALMKKDMGGAATALGLAAMIMTARLPLRLRVLVPVVENAIAGNAFRPGDVLRSRKGLTVEIGNTDAEGRLILADAMALADEEKPEILMTLATLTGAARVALGPDLPPFYTNDEPLAAAIARHAAIENDPLWRMPLWAPYDRMFESPIADINNASDSGFAGSITAALFLRRFVEKAAAYVHFDIFAWTPAARPGRPKGGEAQAMRALFAMLESRYGK